MELRQIRYFVDVVRRGSINKTAQALNIAQPALTRLLRSLEEEVGAQLLVRTSKGVHLTDVGKTMFEHGEIVLQDVARLRHAVTQSRTMPTGAVRLGLAPSHAFNLAPILIEQSRRRFPDLRLHIVETLGACLPDWLESDLIDVALMTDGEYSQNIEKNFIAEEDIVVSGVPSLFSAPLSSIAWREAARVPLIITPGLHAFIAPWAKKKGVQMNVEIEINSIHAVMELIGKGLYATILPYSVIWKKADSGHLRAIPFTDPPITRRLVTAYSAARPISPRILAVHHLLTDAIQSVRLQAQRGAELPALARAN